jgi:hypothetical protein
MDLDTAMRYNYEAIGSVVSLDGIEIRTEGFSEEYKRYSVFTVVKGYEIFWSDFLKFNEALEYSATLRKKYKNIWEEHEIINGFLIDDMFSKNIKNIPNTIYIEQMTYSIGNEIHLGGGISAKFSNRYSLLDWDSGMFLFKNLNDALEYTENSYKPVKIYLVSIDRWSPYIEKTWRNDYPIYKIFKGYVRNLVCNVEVGGKIIPNIDFLNVLKKNLDIVNSILNLIQ